MSFIGFDELIVIVVIALVVLGPQKTFKAAFYLGGLFKKIRDYMNKVKTEMGLDEVKDTIKAFKENDFSEALKHKSPKTVTNTTGKRMWTVTSDDFKNESKTSDITTSSTNSPDTAHKSLDKSKDTDLLKRIDLLEKELSELKAKIDML